MQSDLDIICRTTYLQILMRHSTELKKGNPEDINVTCSV